MFSHSCLGKRRLRRGLKKRSGGFEERMSSFDLNFPIRTKAALARVKEKHPNRKNTGRKGFSTRKRIKRNASLHKMTHTLFFYFSHRLSVGRVVIVIANQVEDTVDEIEKSFE